MNWLATYEFAELPPVKVTLNIRPKIHRERCTRHLYSLVRIGKKCGERSYLCSVYQHESLSTDALNEWMNPKPVGGFELDELQILWQLAAASGAIRDMARRLRKPA